MKTQTNYSQQSINFLPHHFDYKKGSVSNNQGNEVFMEPRLKELFYILLKHENDFVSRDELMAFVWKDIIVSEQSVTKAVSDLRKFISDNQLNNLKIITISKLGYKLEIEENSKKSALNRLIKPVFYALGVIGALIIIIRAMRYEQ